MTAASVALGLRARYPLQAARAKAFHRWLKAAGPTLSGRDHPTRTRFWLAVCFALDAEPTNA